MALPWPAKNKDLTIDGIVQSTIRAAFYQVAAQVIGLKTGTEMLGVLLNQTVNQGLFADDHQLHSAHLSPSRPVASDLSFK